MIATRLHVWFLAQPFQYQSIHLPLCLFSTVSWLADWQTDRLTDLETDRLTDWQTYSLTDWQTDRLTDWQTDRLTDLQPYRLTDWQTDRLTEWQTDRLTDRQIDKRTWQTDRQTGSVVNCRRVTNIMAPAGWRRWQRPSLVLTGVSQIP